MGGGAGVVDFGNYWLDGGAAVVVGKLYFEVQVLLDGGAAE